nr:hypothetical protein [Endozoicomonas sp.]
RLSQNPRSHALRGNAYGSGRMWRNLSLSESVGVSGWLFTCGEYGMHSHAEHGNEVSGGFCNNLLLGDDEGIF